MEATFDNKTNLIFANVRSSVDNSVLYNITTTHNLWGRTVTHLKDANPALGTKSPIVGAIYWNERLFEVNGYRKSISDIKRKPPGFAAAGDQPQSKSRSSGKHKRNRSISRAKDEQRKKRERSRDAGGKEKDNKSRSKTKGQHKKSEPQSKSQANSSVAVVPGCTTYMGFARRSPILFVQIDLREWWRSVTCTTRFWRWSADRTEYELVYHHEQWKALVNLEDDDDEKSSRTVIAPARTPHMRRRSTSVTYAARNSTTINPGRNSGFSATLTATATTTANKQQAKRSRHSSAFFSIGSFARLPQGADSDQKDDDEKQSECEPEEELDPEKAKEERRTRASLFIPYRNHLFHKNKPAVLVMKSKALLQDEVFLLLVLVYSEIKRQDRTNSSGGW